MSNSEDEVLLIFLEESREHLAGIEEDLLAVEEAGENIDQELVNRVFRAIHTVKGGSGFFALDKIKDLSHVMENVLDQIRKERLVPTSAVINALLEGSDLLRSMINNPDTMDSVDISLPIAKLEQVKQDASGGAGPAPAEEPEEQDLIPILNPDNQVVFEISPDEIQRAKKEEKGGNLLYLVEYDLIDDIERKNKNPWDVIKEALTLTYFIDSKVDFGAVGSLEGDVESMRIPFYVLLSTVMDKGLLSYFLGLPEGQIYSIQASDEAEEKSEEVAPTPIPTPVEEKAEEPSIVEPIAKELKEAKVSNMTQDSKKSEPTAKPSKPAAASSSPQPGGKQPVKGEGSVRVNLKVLDKLMTLAGELVLTRNQLLQSGSEENLQAMQAASQSVDHLTTELQDAIMATRMQSIGLVFNKFKRIVRDMSGNLGKSIALTLEGEDVELDRTIIEKIGDPLTHLVRNSVDHGIEMPDERIQAGKEARGHIHLKATHEAGFVVIDIIDDGKGLHLDRIKNKALQSGIVTQTELDEMSEKDIQLLIFKPGFSTAKEVTEISGRGVGMDVVRTNINDLGGIVDLESTPGEGTKMQIKLPLTLAILPSLMIKVQAARFAIPQANLLELVRITARDVKNRIETIGDAPVMRLRGELLPLVSMREVLGIQQGTWTDESGVVREDRRKNIADRRSPVAGQARDDSPEENKRRQNDRRHSPSSSVNIAVVLAGDMKLGLIVDQLLDSSEIVVKPLGVHLKRAKIYAGATIMGDGGVALILDMFGIRQYMKLDQVSLAEQTDLEQQRASSDGLKDRHELLIVENGDDEFFAIPLDLVLRIEKIQTADIQVTGGQKAIKYRGGSLGLFAIEDVAKVTPRSDSDIASIIVFKVANREVGILVKQVIDILQTNVEIDGMTHKQDGIFGSAVIDEKITLFLDLYGIVNHMAPQWVQTYREAESEATLKGKTILLVEDSKFFTTQISEFLIEAGYKVLTALDGNLGLEVVEKQGDDIDLIITDIEMPNMDGYEMVRTLRKNSRMKDLPIIAVTSVSGDRARDKGLKAGMDAYLIKLDREEILHHINGYLNHGRSWKK